MNFPPPNWSRLERVLKKNAQEVAEATALRLCVMAGIQILAEAIKLAPVDTGTLRASQFMLVRGQGDPPFPRFNDENLDERQVDALNDGWKVSMADAKAAMDADQGVRVVIGFGAFYAIFVHEDMTATHAGGTSAKFLEIAVNNYNAAQYTAWWKQTLALQEKA